MMYARIAVNIPSINGVFDYQLPAGMEDIRAGQLVTVPFGKQTVQGVVLELVKQASVAETKPILEVLDPLPVVTPVQLDLARWMADHFLGSLPAMIDLMLPTGLAQQVDTVYELRRAGMPPGGGKPSPVVARLLKLLGER